MNDSVDQAVSLRGDPSNSADAAESKPTNSQLSARELDILRLLIEGMTDKEIGANLQISPLTASTHVKRILKKLGVPTRSAAIAWALRGNMIPH